MKLYDDLSVDAWGVDIVLPAGTRVREVANGMGVIEYAIDDVALLQRLTGNSHDPVYRWLFVPGEAVDSSDAAG